MFGRTVRVIVTAALPYAGATACGGQEPRAPTILRALDEPHAVAIMARAFREFGIEPVRNRLIQFGAGPLELRLDVAARDRRFGIAYITWQDADRLGDDLPKRRDPEAIIVVRGQGDDDDVRAALFFAADYMQDDLSGEEHTATSIAAERRLELATRDVLRRAIRENWP
ncbi:MAG TPA: hypothetical protein VE987_01300 [Polyangiaceae bacterium]|nr:hypothetical protein [Polyangiaceae bacterium]